MIQPEGEVANIVEDKLENSSYWTSIRPKS